MPTAPSPSTSSPTPSRNGAVRLERKGPVTVITVYRLQARNAVDGPTAQALADAFRAFEADTQSSVAVLTGGGEHFCAGADLKALGNPMLSNRLVAEGDGPMGPTRMALSKPVIAAIEGFAVAGGLELALWCDLRVASEHATLGVFCRRWGVPLIDGGTVRLARLIGESRAMDLVLTGRAVGANEALAMGLVNRIAPGGQALAHALTLAHELAALPQRCMRSDRQSLRTQWGLSMDDAMRQEFELGIKTLASGESLAGAQRFADGAGRHGQAEGPL